jgi:plastocyanin
VTSLRFAWAGPALAGLVLGLAGCVSDRAAGPRIDIEGCNVQLPAEAFGSTIVVIRDFNFSPSQVTVAPGGRVTWVSCEPPGSESHTSTADAGAWSSQLLAPGATFTRQFAAAGTFPYHCEPHPGMRATVTVQ